MQTIYMGGWCLNNYQELVLNGQKCCQNLMRDLWKSVMGIVI